MTQAVADSDDEEVIGDENAVEKCGAENAESGEHPVLETEQELYKDLYPELDADKERTQSTGSTEKMLREAHNTIAQPAPLPRKRRKTKDRAELTDHDTYDMNSVMRTESSTNKHTRSRLKRTKTSEGPMRNEDFASKRQRRSHTTEDWTGPSGSSQISIVSNHSGARTEKQNGKNLYLEALPKGVNGTQSTVMNTSSDDRRARELADEAHLEHSNTKQTNRELPNQSSERYTASPKSHGPEPSTQETHVSVEAASTPPDRSETIVVLPASTQVSKRKENQRGATISPMPPRKSNQKRAHESNPGLNLSDELAVSLPIEQYRPRPSRSRSLRLPEIYEGKQSEIEVSTATQFREQSRKKRKRAKTTGDVETDPAEANLVSKTDGPAQTFNGGLKEGDVNVRRDDAQVVEGDNRSIEPDDRENHVDEFQVTIERNGESEETTIVLAKPSMTLQNQRRSELRPDSAIKESRKSRTVVAEDEDDADDNAIELANLESEESDDYDELSTQHPRKSRQSKSVGTSKKPAKAQEPGGKKKGRGRPKKSQTLYQDNHIGTNMSNNTGTSSGQEDTKEQLPQETVHEAEEVKSQGFEKEPAELPRYTNEKEGQGGTVSIVATPLPPPPPGTAQEKIKGSEPNPTKLSPLNKNAVPLRVGLSRRIRIEPLLKCKRR